MHALHVVVALLVQTDARCGTCVSMDSPSALGGEGEILARCCQASIRLFISKSTPAFPEKQNNDCFQFSQGSKLLELCW